MGLEENRKRGTDESDDTFDVKKGRFNIHQKGPLIKTIVPNVVAGIVIGKGGKNLAELREKYGGYVRVSSPLEYYPGTEERVIVIHGTTSEIIENYKYLLQICKDTGKGPLHDGRGEKNMIVVTLKGAGKLIGKGGANIKKVKEDFSVGISIAKSVGGTASEDQVLTMTGDLEKRMEASEYLINQIAEDDDNMNNVNVKYNEPTTITGSQELVQNANFVGRRSIGSNDKRAPSVDDLIAAAQRSISEQILAATTQPEKKKPSVFKSMIEAHLEIPDKVVGHIMGKNGQTVKSMVASSKGARFVFSGKDEFVDDTTNRKLTISGTLDQVSAAFDLVQAKGAECQQEGLL